MSMSPGLRNVLDILSELAHNDSETDVSENNITKRDSTIRGSNLLKRIRVSAGRILRYYYKR